ncbi:tyrosine phosphatase family protein [soil metagenome]
MIVVAPLHEVDEALRRWKPSHVVGMASPGAELFEFVEDVQSLRLIFHDIVEAREGLHAVTKTDVVRLLDFAAGWSRAAPLLVQCWAGVSRSPAAAYVVACGIAGSGHEERLARSLRAAAPFATPNRRLVALADVALERNGAMIAAIDRIGRGAETSTGVTFVLEV